MAVPPIEPATMWIVVAFLVALAAFVFFMRRRTGGSAPTSDVVTAETVDDYIAAHGTPEEVLVLDATRSDELSAVVLVYENEIVIDCKRIERDKVEGVTFYNAQNPYMASEYTLAVTTADPDCPSAIATIGGDVERARELTTHLAELLSSTRIEHA